MRAKVSLLFHFDLFLEIIITVYYHLLPQYQEMARNLTKTFVFAFHHNNRHNKVSGYIFIIKIFARTNAFKKV